MKPKIVNMKAKNEMVAALETLKRDLPTIIEYQVLTAKIAKAKYDALIAEEFTEDQALELCKEL